MWVSSKWREQMILIYLGCKCDLNLKLWNFEVGRNLLSELKIGNKQIRLLKLEGAPKCSSGHTPCGTPSPASLMDGNPTAARTHLVGVNSLFPKTPPSSWPFLLTRCFLMPDLHLMLWSTHLLFLPLPYKSSIKWVLCVFHRKAYCIVTAAFMFLSCLAIAHMACQIVRVSWKWRSEQRFILACLLPWNL